MDQILENYGDFPLDPELTISTRLEMINSNIEYYVIPYSKEHLFSQRLPKYDSIMVQSHLFDFKFRDYLEIIVNFWIAFLDNTISIQTVGFTNCTLQTFELVIYYQQFDVHISDKRWEPAIEESANMLEMSDPIAKACVPAFYEIILDSDEYGPSFQNLNRVIYNVFYRLGLIYENTYLLDLAIREFFKHKNDEDGED
jgi:hypothetical protein